MSDSLVLRMAGWPRPLAPEKIALEIAFVALFLLEPPFDPRP